MPYSSNHKNSIQHTFKYTATVIIPAAFSICIWSCKQPAPPPLQHLRDTAVTYITYKGEPGQRKEVRLADSTQVILNARSLLLVPDNFTQERTLLLDGEAFFNATDPTAKPLTVKTNILTLTTQPAAAFKIRSFEVQHGATAYLLHGKIKVTKSYHSATDNQPEILERGQMVLANNEIDLMEKETYVPEELENWLQGRLVLHDETFMNTVRILENWYSTEITVNGNASGTGPVNGDFNNATLQQVLQALQKTGGFTYQLKDNKVTVDF